MQLFYGSIFSGFGDGNVVDADDDDDTAADVLRDVVRNKNITATTFDVCLVLVISCRLSLNFANFVVDSLSCGDM